MADVDPVLPWIKPGWVGVEIGVAEGNSAAALLRHGVRFLYLIDPWTDYDGLLDKVTPGSYEKAMEQLSPYASRHGTLRMPSADAAQYVPEVDFVWIDGNHRYEWAKKDLELYWSKVRSGGILCGHDYCNTPETCQVKRAVDEFMPIGTMKMTPIPNSSCWAIWKP